MIEFADHKHVFVLCIVQTMLDLLATSLITMSVAKDNTARNRDFVQAMVRPPPVHNGTTVCSRRWLHCRGRTTGVMILAT